MKELVKPKISVITPIWIASSGVSELPVSHGKTTA